MKRLQVIESRTQPDNTNVLWLNLENDVIYRFSESGWIPVKADESITENAKCVTHSELVELRDSKKLIPGTFYRITNYSTNYLRNNNSAGDLGNGVVFDIIVLAIDNDKLREEASICLPKYGKNTLVSRNLLAWKIWYKLDNATEYDWYAKGAPGLIYRMIDEYNNDVYYDFVNIGVKSASDFVCRAIFNNREGIYIHSDSLKCYFWIDDVYGIKQLSASQAQSVIKRDNILATFGGYKNNAVSSPFYYKNNTIKYSNMTPPTYKINCTIILDYAANNTINLQWSYLNAVNIICKRNSNNNISRSQGLVLIGDDSLNNKIESAFSVVLKNLCAYNNLKEVNNIILQDYSSFNNMLACNNIISISNIQGNDFKNISYVDLPIIRDSKLTNVTNTKFGTQETTSNTICPRFYNIRNYRQDTEAYNAGLPVYLKVNKSKGELFQSSKTVGSDTSTITYTLIDGSNVQQITYSKLVTAMKCNNLIPGMCYEITDYQTTVEASHLQATGETFCITLRAKSDHELEEEAVAIRRPNATAFLNWKVWYKPLYDPYYEFVKETTPGFKGIIYRMIDGWGNDLPYDFYSVKIKGEFINNRSKLPFLTSDAYYFTFAAVDNGNILSGVNALTSNRKVHHIYGNKWIFPSFGMQGFNIGSVFVTSKSEFLNFSNNTFDYSRMDLEISLECSCISCAAYVFENYIETVRFEAYESYNSRTGVYHNYIRNNGSEHGLLCLEGECYCNTFIDTTGNIRRCRHNIFEKIVGYITGTVGVIQDLAWCKVVNTWVYGVIRGHMEDCIIENCEINSIVSTETTSTNLPIKNYIVRSINIPNISVMLSTVNSPDVIEVIPTSKTPEGYAEINKSDLIDLLYPSTPETTE